MRRVCGEGVLACVFLAATLLFAARETAAGETILRSRLNSDMLSTNPGVLRDENTDAVLLHVVEGLVAYREDLSVGPLLAERWDVAKDGRAYTFHLRDGVHFQNGAPLTSSEVVWSIRRYLDPRTHWRCLHDFDGGGVAKITSVDALDLQTVRITLDKASPWILASLARQDCGETAILHPSSVGPDGAWRGPVGTGPFQLADWKHNQYVDLVRFPAYQALPGPRDGNTGGKQALVNRLRFIVIPDNTSAVAALASGQLDVLDGLTPMDIAPLRARRDVHLDIHPTMDLYAILFETRDPLLKDERIRQAIAATIDVGGLTRVITQGYSPPNRSIIPFASRFHDQVQAAVPPPNLAEARRLLKAAGYQGQTIRLITNHRYPAMFNIAVLVQAMARQAGIQIEIDTLDWATQLSHYNAGTYQAMAFGYSARMDASLSLETLIGDKNADTRKVWEDPEARVLLERSRLTAEPAERQAIFDQLQALFLQQAPAVSLYNSARIAAVRSNVVGYAGWSAAQQRLWGVGLK